jgi:hypothetical protein
MPVKRMPVEEGINKVKERREEKRNEIENRAQRISMFRSTCLLCRLNFRSSSVLSEKFDGFVILNKTQAEERRNQMTND